MAVDVLTKNIPKRFKKRAASYGLLFIIIQATLAAAVIWFFDLYENHLIESIGIASAFIFISVLSNMTSSKIFTYPLTKLSAAISHISGEQTDEKPPIPNDKKITKLGLDLTVKKLYELSSSKELQIDETSGEVVQKTKEEPVNRTDLSRALENTICGFVVMNKERRIVYANKAAPVKVSSDGEVSLELVFNEKNAINEWWDECEHSAVKAENTWSRVSNKLPGDENRRIFDVLASYNKGDENEVVLMLVDRTNIYEISEKELDFIAFAAHELRGPITVIRGYIDVLQEELEDKTDNEQKELFKRLRVSSHKLSGYINNILNTSRYDRRHLKVHLVESSVEKIYESIKDDMQLRAESQNRLLNVSFPQDLPTIPADKTSLGEVFANIIDNAIKYSNEGGTINVTAKLSGEFVDISVQDFGIGMPGNVVGNLFQKFYRSHRSRETVAGTGIGLYISKATVAAHGGTILVRSEEGKGSTFTVSVPTYRSVADKLKDGSNELIAKESSGSWIKNHSVFRG